MFHDALDSLSNLSICQEPFCASQSLISSSIYARTTLCHRDCAKALTCQSLRISVDCWVEWAVGIGEEMLVAGALDFWVLRLKQEQGFLKLDRSDRFSFCRAQNG